MTTTCTSASGRSDRTGATLGRVTEKLYRDLVLLHLAAFLVIHEALWTPPPFDITVASLAGALAGTPAALRLDRRQHRRETRRRDGSEA